MTVKKTHGRLLGTTISGKTRTFPIPTGTRKPGLHTHSRPPNTNKPFIGLALSGIGLAALSFAVLTGWKMWLCSILCLQLCAPAMGAFMKGNEK